MLKNLFASKKVTTSKDVKLFGKVTAVNTTAMSVETGDFMKPGATKTYVVTLTDPSQIVDAISALHDEKAVLMNINLAYSDRYGVMNASLINF